MTDINRIRNQITNFYNKKKEQKRKTYNPYANHYYKYYHSPQWQALRANYYANHPCCEICERQGIVTPAEECHHLRVWDSGITEADKWKLLLDPNNLCSTCRDCHRTIHKYLRDKHLDYATIDDIVEYKQQLEAKLNQFD